ncbi:NADP-mannitol dehydrogenase [Yamadazyma tenuis]|uniref:NAD(P)-binding protein n=1 Tax=Candida tenuis (strain ATCC 10573 / BCRC 21748 / CBS 615 / JCM 9827 / NBRC 10315 / NRRL Y-1498 / VKM Y-70) TaxID=590646 RepID=G3AZQ8_CANTC|nr:uncharacterized protein CANTEDRAFT_119297 [Yamadazyma tenuis ATCC 10573]EGV65214.1 hypothetical protein CANTEDRAFT_119297 [Yamadazyma tenuis ATCC 10573]WEJ95132.1 NADP-mannitol dehydrogenase [Yamadazyma tenuis]
MGSGVKSIIREEIGSLPRPNPELAENVLDLFSLKGKVATITGSSQGIGFAVAEAYAQAGADVAIWYNSTPAGKLAEDLSSKYGVKVKAYKANVDVFEEVKSTILKIEKEFGTIDIFVANAGIGSKPVSVIDSSLEDYHKILRINVDHVYYAAKVVGRIFKKNGKGSFIITASQAGHIVTVPLDQAAYNASKAALIQIAKSLAIEWVGFARVNAISPGYIATEIAKHIPLELKEKWWSLIPMGREGLPKELVGGFLYFASDASTFTTGSDLIIDGGYTVP